MSGSDLLIKDIRFFEAVSDISMPVADATHSIPVVDGGALVYGF
jgi:hypothetical protein